MTVPNPYPVVSKPEKSKGLSNPLFYHVNVTSDITINSFNGGGCNITYKGLTFSVPKSILKQIDLSIYAHEKIFNSIYEEELRLAKTTAPEEKITQLFAKLNMSSFTSKNEQDSLTLNFEPNIYYPVSIISIDSRGKAFVSFLCNKPICDSNYFDFHKIEDTKLDPKLLFINQNHFFSQ